MSPKTIRKGGGGAHAINVILAGFFRFVGIAKCFARRAFYKGEREKSPGSIGERRRGINGSWLDFFRFARTYGTSRYMYLIRARGEPGISG